MADRMPVRRLIVAGIVIIAGVGLSVTVALLAPPARGVEVEPGTVRGTVTVTGVRPGVSTGGWVHACRAGQPFGPGCDGQKFLPADADGSYSVDLDAGAWQIAGGYREFHRSGPPPVLGDPVPVTVEGGRVTSQDLVVAYQPSGIVEGKVTVTGLPSGADVVLGVFACRSGSTFEPFCTGGGFDLFFDERYSLSLLPGDWRIAAGYGHEGNSVLSPPVAFHLDGAETRRLDLEVPFDPTLPPRPPPPPVPTIPPPSEPRPPSNQVSDGIVNGIFTSVPCSGAGTPPPSPPAEPLVAPPGFVLTFAG